MAELTSLNRLSLYATSVTDAGLKHLSSLQKLDFLNLSHCDTMRRMRRTSSQTEASQPPRLPTAELHLATLQR